MKRTNGVARHLLSAAALALSLTAAASAQSPATQTAAEPTCQELATALRAVTSNDLRMKDWPNLARYRDANRAVLASSDTVDAVFLGDSITDSWQQARFNFFPGKRYVDRGISAQTTPQMLLRMRADVLALKPKVLVILAGTNDIAGNTGPMTDEDIQGNLMSISELAAAHGIKVVLSSITPVSEYHMATPLSLPQTSQRPMTRITAINKWMRAYAEAHGHVYLDYFSAMTDDRGLLKTEFSADDLHPNAAGYAVMAPLAEAAIAKAVR